MKRRFIVPEIQMSMVEEEQEQVLKVFFKKQERWDHPDCVDICVSDGSTTIPILRMAPGTKQIIRLGLSGAEQSRLLAWGFTLHHGLIGTTTM